MLWKLSLTGLKSRFKDYAVLFSGLTLAAAIFYMFLTLALNPNFLKKALPLAYQTTSVVFGFGIVLLAIITFVYIIYANSFLLSMRKRDYGMYMMLGARNSKIGHLIFMETLIVGILSTGLGIIIGIFLTQLISHLLISQLGLVIHHFVGFYPLAVLWTVIFFAILFFLAAIWNRIKLTQTNIITLIHEDQKPVKLHVNKAWKIIEAVLGLILLAVGYWAMADYKQLMLNSIPLALFTIILGSYSIFSSFFTAIINLLQQNYRFAYRGLHIFTLGQLKFRINSYNRILTVVSLLFALALGAITVGLNFNSMTNQQLEATYYDAVLPNKTKVVEKELKKISLKKETVFAYKTDAKYIYVNEKQIRQDRLKAQAFFEKGGQAHYQTISLTPAKIKEERSQVREYFDQLLPASGQKLKFVSEQKFKQIPVKTQTVTLLLVNNFKRDWHQVEKVQELAVKKQKQWDSSNFKTANYQAALALASGFEFMGFFLGLAFLAMLASTLMFKVLSGANSDKPRYEMLWKIGARNKLLKHSIAKEIGVLFSLPAALGIVDVLFGLQFFKSLLENPYDKIWIPFTIFLALYLLYYLLTVKLYEGIVLKKK